MSFLTKLTSVKDIHMTETSLNEIQIAVEALRKVILYHQKVRKIRHLIKKFNVLLINKLIINKRPLIKRIN